MNLLYNLLDMGSDFSNRFLTYIQTFYDSAIVDFLNEWIKENYKLFYLEPINKNEIFVSNLDFKFANIGDKDDSRIEFQIVVDATFRFKEMYDRHSIIERNRSGNWITLSFVGTIENYFDHLGIIGCEPYCGKKVMKHPVTGDLLPKLFDIKEYEKYAINFIRKHYDKRYDGSKPVDILKLIKACGIEVWDFKFAGKIRPFGRIFFERGKFKAFDDDGVTEVVNTVERNTILVDITQNNKHSENKKNTTLAHEFAHYMLHRKSFYFQRLMETDMDGFECSYSDGVKAKGFTPYLLRKMEIQANIMAPILLMPRKAVIEYTKSIYHDHIVIGGDDDVLNFIEDIIHRVAAHFHVTVYAARRRLFDCGFFQTADACLWIDGKYVRPYAFKKGSLGRDETFVLTAKQLKSLVFDKESSSLFRFGDFVYVENHLCINSTRYVTPDTKGNLSLTYFARHNVDKCCLKFKLLDVSKETGELKILNSLFRDSTKELAYNVALASNSAGLENRLNSDRRIRYHANVLEAKKNIIGLDFGDSLRYLMRFQKMSMQELANDCDLSLSTIKRYTWTDKTKRTLPDKPCAIKICIGLQLCSELAVELCKKANICFNDYDETDGAYLMVINTMTQMSVQKITKCLELMGMPNILNATNLGSAR